MLAFIRWILHQPLLRFTPRDTLVRRFEAPDPFLPG